MVKDISALDLDTDYDILYFYRNASSYPEHLDVLSDRRISDINICLLCYGFVETGVMRELRLGTVDSELEYLMRDSSACRTEGTPVDQKSIMPDDRFHISNLGALLRPLIGVCDKQVVDVIFFVYRLAGVSHFDVLFREFSNAKDLLIELHLLVVRGSRSRSFDLKDIRESLARESAGDRVPKSDEVDFFDESSEQVPDPKDGGEVELGCFSEDREDCADARPFVTGRNTNPQVHLDQARRFLLSFTIKDQNFYIENLSTYLSLKFDRTLYLMYIRTPKTPHFYRSLSKFASPPFFLYKGVDIRCLLIENIKSYVRSGRSGPRIVLDLEDAGGDAGIGDAHRVYKHTLVCNCYTLKYFMEFAMSTFADYEAPIENYPLIARSLHHFVGEYRHPALFRILHGLIESRLDRVYREMKEWILLSIDLYIEVFYRPFGEGDLSKVDLEERLRAEWTVGKAGEDPEDAGAAGDSIPDHAAGEDTRYGRTPSLEDSEDGQVAYFTQPGTLQPLQRRISNFLLVRFYRPFDMVAAIDAFLISASCDRHLKIHVLNAAGSLARIGAAARDKIITHLFETEGTPWRYRAALLRKRDALVRLGASPALFAQFATDRVYFVRRLAERSLCRPHT